MSYCKKEGKDRVMFVTEDDHAAPSTIKLPEDFDEPPGIILPNGEINWSCPCLGGMPTGPCGFEFREAFSCFQYSKSTPKGTDCLEKFHEMQECMSKYPNLYPRADPMDDDEFSEEAERDGSSDAESKVLAVPEVNESSSSSKKTDTDSPEPN